MSNISERLEQQADLLFNNVAGWERKALRRIGRRVKDIKSLSYADLQAINSAAIVKQDVDAILKELATLTGQSSIEVKRIYAEMINKQHEENKVLYDYRGKPFIPLANHKQLQAIVRAYARTTAETMVNLSMTKAKRLGFVDKNNNFVSLEKNFKEVLDKAVMSITTGTGDFNSEMRSALEELGGSGLRVDYGGGVTRRLDTMVRQNLLWGAKQASVTYNEMIGEELGCDGIELDWHSNPRPSHEFMQGKQYALGKARVINGRLFESADDALNALNDYGCLHFKTPIICGVSEPRYSDEELAMLNAQNARKIQIDGVSKTGYEWKQTMRKLENEARKTQDQIEILKASGDNEGVKQLKSKLTAIEDKYNLVAKSSGIKAQPQRMSVIKSKTIDNPVKNGIISVELYRNALDVSNVEPMPDEQFTRIQKRFERNGGIFSKDKEANDYVVARHKEAITLNADTVVFRYNPSRAAVFEELIHTFQYKTGKLDGSELRRCLCEIEAKEKLLRYSKAYGLTDKEVEITKRLLEEDKKNLANLKRGEG